MFKSRWPLPILVGLTISPVISLSFGCGKSSHPADASPVVAADSEAGRKAIAESEALLRLRQKQEASRKRTFVAPEG